MRSLLLLLLLVGSAFADETGRLEGRVAPGVTIVVVGIGGETPVPVEDGRFHFEGAPGTYRIVAIYGDQRQTEDVTIAAGVTTRVKLTVDTTHAGETITIHEHGPREPVAVKPQHDYQRLRLPYSDEAIDENIWFAAWLLLHVDEHGKVQWVRFVQRPGVDLEKIAIEKVMAYRFEPARDEFGDTIPSVVLWKMDWPPFWRTTLTEQIMGAPPCRGDGPIDLGAYDPEYRDCSHPSVVVAANEPAILDAKAVPRALGFDDRTALDALTDTEREDLCGWQADVLLWVNEPAPSCHPEGRGTVGDFVKQTMTLMNGR
jgi:hypothetical protein